MRNIKVDIDNPNIPWEEGFRKVKDSLEDYELFSGIHNYVNIVSDYEGDFQRLLR